ncbi:hypothetical protein IGI04_030433 [Brassica rapa subsp. trilocularis]|uniref:Uncharacterized protein n=1 Tax=Brassica rapa subsp. trilocularis TaxID=1813537 RepID=A0ABQ7LQP3_BRACM|nr:hypothetical protein IGI04_030433 [Brassica rapa subsp. trilocularis]
MDLRVESLATGRKGPTGLRFGFNRSQAQNRFVGQNQNQNQQNLQSNQQAAPAADLNIMMQQILQGLQIRGKALNQVNTYINTRMENMFTELNRKYDTVRNHIKRIDVQLAQTAESVKKTDKNPRAEHCNAIELRCEKADGKETKQLSA